MNLVKSVYLSTNREMLFHGVLSSFLSSFLPSFSLEHSPQFHLRPKDDRHFICHSTLSGRTKGMRISRPFDGQIAWCASWMPHKSIQVSESRTVSASRWFALVWWEQLAMDDVKFELHTVRLSSVNRVAISCKEIRSASKPFTKPFSPVQSNNSICDLHSSSEIAGFVRRTPMIPIYDHY